MTKITSFSIVYSCCRWSSILIDVDIMFDVTVAEVSRLVAGLEETYGLNGQLLSSLPPSGGKRLAKILFAPQVEFDTIDLSATHCVCSINNAESRVMTRTYGHVLLNITIKD